MTIDTTLMPVSEIKPEMAIDLERDAFADPKGEHTEFEFEFQEVFDIERETPDCIALWFTNFGCGFPPDHLLPVQIASLSE